jgi:hypothetical protein
MSRVLMTPPMFASLTQALDRKSRRGAFFRDVI